MARLDFPGLVRASESYRTPDDRSEPRGQGRMTGTLGRARAGHAPDVDAEGRQCASVKILGGGSRVRYIRAERDGDGGVVKETEQQVVGADPAVASPGGLVCGVCQHRVCVFGQGSEHDALLPVFGVHGLSGYAERVADLLPGPALFSGCPDLLGLDLFRQSAQSLDRPKPDGGIGRLELRDHILTHHAVSLS